MKFCWNRGFLPRFLNFEIYHINEEISHSKLHFSHSEVGIYKIKILRKKERKHAFDQEINKIHVKRKNTCVRLRKNDRKQDLDQK